MLEEPSSTGSDPSQTKSTHSKTSSMPPLALPPNLKFGPFPVSSGVFHLSRSRLTYGLINLKPLLPGHILVIPVRPVPRLSQLTTAETADLFVTVQKVSRTLERLYSADAFNVAVQDGVAAGQSVPHVHVHVIPRHEKDMDGKGGCDHLYELMDGEEGNIGSAMVDMLRRRKAWQGGREGEFGGPDAEENREPRTEEDMREEAEWMRLEMEKDVQVDDDVVGST